MTLTSDPVTLNCHKCHVEPVVSSSTCDDFHKKYVDAFAKHNDKCEKTDSQMHAQSQSGTYTHKGV